MHRCKLKVIKAITEDYHDVVSSNERHRAVTKIQVWVTVSIVVVGFTRHVWYRVAAQAEKVWKYFGRTGIFVERLSFQSNTH